MGTRAHLKTIQNLPNFLTVARLLLTPIILYWVRPQSTFFLIASLSIFIFAMATDALDGYIARRYHCITNFGTIMDPLADKMLLLGLMFVFSELEMVPLWISLLYLFRELLQTGVRQIAGLKGILVGANWMGKVKVTLQIVLVLYTYYALIATSEGIILPNGIEIIFWGHVVILSLSFLFTGFFIRSNWHNIKTK